MSRYTLTLSLVALVLSAFVWGLSSCGGGGGNSGAPVVKITPTDNQAPVAKRAFENIALSLESGGQAEWRSDDIGVYFSDPDGDSLEFRAESSDGDVASVAFAGDALEVRATGGGSATVTVTATDPRGLSGSQKFTVIVSDGTANNAPVIVRPFDDLTLTIGDGGEWESEEFLTYFSEPDGDTHTYRVEASPGDVVRAELHYVEGRGLTLIVQALKPGTATITVSMTDSGGLSTSQSFRVTVLDGVAPPPDHSDTPAGAREIVSGDSVEGHLDSPDDIDMFRIRIAETSTIDVTLTSEEAGIEIALLDSSGIVLATAVTASEARLLTTVQRGEFFARVRALGPALKQKLGELSEGFNLALKVAKNIESLINILEGRAEIDVEVGGIRGTFVLGKHFEFPSGSTGRAFKTSLSVAGLTATLEQDALRISAAEDAVPGALRFTVTASAFGLPNAVKVFQVNLIEGSNLPPTSRCGSLVQQTVDPGQSATFLLSECFTDDQPDELVFATSIVGSGTEWQVGISLGNLEVQSGVGMSSRDFIAVEVTATDSSGQSAMQAFRVNLNKGLPAIRPQSVPVMSLEADAIKTIDLTRFFEDPEGSLLTFQLGREPDGLSLRQTGSSLSVSADTDASGGYKFQVTAIAADGRSNVFTFRVNVTASLRELTELTISAPAGETTTVRLTDYIGFPQGVSDPPPLGLLLLPGSGTMGASLVWH